MQHFSINSSSSSRIRLSNYVVNCVLFVTEPPRTFTVHIMRSVQVLKTIYTPNGTHIVYSHLMQKGIPLQTAKSVTREIHLKKVAVYQHDNRKCHWQHFPFIHHGIKEILLHHNEQVLPADCSWSV